MSRLLLFIVLIGLSALAVIVRLLVLGLAVPCRNACRLCRVVNGVRTKTARRELEQRTASPAR